MNDDRVAMARLGRNARYEAIFNSTDRFVGLLTPDGTVVEANRTALDLGGLEPAEVLGKPLWETRWWSLSEESRERLREAVADAARGESVRFQVELRGSGDQVATLDLAIRPVRNADGKVVALIPEGRDVSAQVATERELEAARARFRSIFEHAAAGMSIVAPDGRFLEANPALCAMLGRSPAELLQLELRNVLHPSDLDAVHEYQRALRQASRDSFQLELRLLPKGAAERWIHLVVSAVRDADGTLGHLLLQAHDIHQRKLAEIALRDSETTYRALVASLQEGVLMRDADGRIVACNPSAERILGTDEAHLLGRDSIDGDFEVIGEDGAPFPPETRPGRAALRSGEPVTGARLGIRRSNGELRWLGVNATPLFHEGDDRPYAVVSSFSDITALVEKESQLEHSAYHDPLTDLPNRRYFFDIAARALGDDRRKREAQDAVLYLDLDDFKSVNDVHGHAAGDALLVSIAQRLRAAVRPQDIVARLAGDEFAILLLGVSGAMSAVAIAQRLIADVAEPHHAAGREIVVNASVGISLCPRRTCDPDAVVNRADIALRRAKASSRDRYVVYDAHLAANIRHDLELESDLRQALRQDELALHYQPIMDLQRDRIVGAEALLRWTHPERGQISPAEFIPIAESNGTIRPIGEWILERALNQLKSWLEHDPGLHLGINLSPRQLESKDFLLTFARALALTGVPHEAIMLELTETYLMNDVERAARDLRRFADVGVGIAIDDFGTGYSSLTYLQRLPITHLKIDQTFIRTVSRDDRSQAVVETILTLAEKLGLTVIAEGVETSEQMELLREFGCPLAQGYLFHRPGPPAGFDTLLAEQTGD